jgi:8-oxo-dGTP diphosphatase
MLFSRVALPYTIATLLYCFNERDEVLLMQRLREPNKWLWSPCGGKLITGIGESPYACACREAAEELNLEITPPDLHLLGVVSECGCEGQAHWLMFLFESRIQITTLPPPHPEGAFAFFSRERLASIPIPQTDREQIWPLVWAHRGGFFAAHCRTAPHGSNCWTIEESRPPTN